MRDFRPKAVACAAVLMLGIHAVSPASADSVTDFYKDRQMNLILGFNPGGGFDVYSRLIVRYIVKYIPGEPKIIVRNMPGAGSMIATNYLFNVSPRDGSEFGMFSSDMAIAPLVGHKSAKFDARQFTWLGSASSDVAYCFAWGKSPVHSFEDVLKGEMIIGAAGIQQANIPAALNAVLNTKFRIIKGYAGTAAVKLAMEREEIQGWCGMGLEAITSTNPEWLKDGTIRTLVQVGYQKNDEVPGAPFFLDYAKTEEDKQVLNLMFGYSYLARPFAAPPAIPADRAAVLRSAFAQSISDPALRQEAEHLKLELHLVTGQDIENFLKDIYATPQPTVARAVEIIQATSK